MRKEYAMLSSLSLYAISAISSFSLLVGCTSYAPIKERVCQKCKFPFVSPRYIPSDLMPSKGVVITPAPTIANLAIDGKTGKHLPWSEVWLVLDIEKEKVLRIESKSDGESELEFSSVSEASLNTLKLNRLVRLANRIWESKMQMPSSMSFHGEQTILLIDGNVVRTESGGNFYGLVENLISCISEPLYPQYNFSKCTEEPQFSEETNQIFSKIKTNADQTLLESKPSRIVQSVVLSDPYVLAQRYNCFTCHLIDQKKIGPSFRDVSQKYRGVNMEQNLMSKIRSGGSGVWSPIPMPPNADIPDIELRILVRWITSL